MKKQKKARQKVKIYGFKFPQRLLEDLREFQETANIQIPASAYAAMVVILKQIHREKTTRGEVQELSLPAYASETKIGYSTLYVGFKFWLKHGFLYETVNSAGVPVHALKNAQTYFNEENLNYFIVPHSLFETSIMAELVRTSNSKAFELMFSLLTQFRHGVATIDSTSKIEAIKQVRNLDTLKHQLGKRSKGVREVLDILAPLFDVRYIGLHYRGHQVWIHQVEFTLKIDSVVENTDAFEVNHLVSEFSKQTQNTLTELNIKFKPRDLFDIMIALKQEVINVFKYIAKDKDIDSRYTYRDSWIEDYFYRCLGKFHEKIQSLKYTKQAFKFNKSIGAYFRTIFRNNLKKYIEVKVPVEMIREANMKEYMETGKIPALHQLLTQY